MLQDHGLLGGEEFYQVITRAPQVQDQCNTLSYFYSFNRSEELSDALGEFYTKSFYAWDFRALHAVSASARSKLASSAAPRSSVVAEVVSGPKDVVEAFMDANVAEKKFVARPFDSRTYRQGEF